MSLATRCPHCKTVFLVSEEQLRLRSGTVRCGVCGQTFDGTIGLIGRIVHSSRQNLPESHHRESTNEPDIPAVLPENLLDTADDLQKQQTELPFSGNTVIHSDEAIKAAFDKQLKTISLDLDDFSAGVQSGNNPPDETDIPSPNPGITHQQKRKSRIFGVFWSIGVIFLLLILCGQLLYRYSERIVLWWPPAENVVNTACKLLTCPTGNASEFIPLQVEYGELTTVENSNDRFLQQIVIVNGNPSRRPWPSLVMEISDVQSNEVLSRRVFEPDEYLQNESSIDKEGLPSGRTVFQLNIEYQHDSAVNSRIILINR